MMTFLRLRVTASSICTQRRRSREQEVGALSDLIQAPGETRQRTTLPLMCQLTRPVGFPEESYSGLCVGVKELCVPKDCGGPWANTCRGSFPRHHSTTRSASTEETPSSSSAQHEQKGGEQVM